jgi:putative transposase
VVHLPGRQHRDAIAKAFKLVYPAPTEAAAKERFGEFVQVGSAVIRRSCGCA